MNCFPFSASRLHRLLAATARAVVLAALPLLVLGCASGQRAPEEELSKTTEVYNKLMARMDFLNAAAFVSSPYLAEYEARSQKVRNLNILDHKLLRVKQIQTDKEVEVAVEFEYYYTSSPRTKRIVDHQKWIYVAEGDRMVWRLASPFPDFP